VRNACGSRPDRLKPGILPQHLLLQASQVDTGIQTVLLGQTSTHLGVHIQGLHLPTRAVQGDHLQPSKPLPQRVLGGDHLQVVNHFVVATQRQQHLHMVLDRAQPQAVQASPLAPGDRGKIRQERAPPQRPRLDQHRVRSQQVARGADLPRLINQPLEAQPVDVVRGHLQDVPGRPPDQDPSRLARSPPRFHSTAQVRHIRMHGPGGPGGRIVLPQTVGQLLHRHDPVGLDDQQCEHRTLHRPAQDHRAVAIDHLQRAQRSELHQTSRSSFTPCWRARIKGGGLVWFCSGAGWRRTR
jgi:hypothetical protein